MTTPVWTELICHTCSSASIGRFSFNGRIEVKKLKEEATIHGWVFKHDETFCTEYCLEQYEKNHDE